MTPVQAIIADIDATILYWRCRGIRAAVVAAELRCPADWANVRQNMMICAGLMLALGDRAAQRRAAQG